MGPQKASKPARTVDFVEVHHNTVDFILQLVGNVVDFILQHCRLLRLGARQLVGNVVGVLVHLAVAHDVGAAMRRSGGEKHFLALFEMVDYLLPGLSGVVVGFVDNNGVKELVRKRAVSVQRYTCLERNGRTARR